MSAPGKRMRERGQVTLELLLVMLVFFSALCVWLPAVLNVHKTAGIALETQSARMTADKLSSAINRVYLLGPGNSETMELYVGGGNGTIEFGKREFIFRTASNRTIERTLFSEAVFPDEGSETFVIGGKVRLKVSNENGGIWIRRL